MSHRERFATLADAELLGQCGIDLYRASGPGGQKRNKTSSAVRLRHEPTGLVVIAEESRSQHENKAKALRRLRQAFYLKLREPPTSPSPALDAIRASDGRFALASAKDARYWPAIAALLDVLDVGEARMRDVAESLGTTTANLASMFELHDKAWESLAALRTRHNQKPLRRGE